MGFERKPEDVKKAQIAGNHAALSAMGRAGAKEAAARRALRKEKKETTLLEATLAGAAIGKETDEGDIQPPDPETIEILEEALKSREEQ